jgi:cytoskeleton protein RodZ
MDDGTAHDRDEGPRSVGQRLRAAREASGKSLADIAAQTRVPVRLLDAIERDAVEELPAGPYATGFTRSFALAVGLSPDEMVTATRVLQQERVVRPSAMMDPYEPADDSRVPPARLAVIALFIFLALLAAYLVFRNFATSPATPTAAVSAPPAATAVAAIDAAAQTAPATSATPAVALPADARLIIKAYENVWFSLEDERGRSQFDLTLDGGEYYTIRPNQRGLRLRTGKPQALRIVVGDRELPQLGAPDTVVGGVSLDIANLGRIAAGGAANVPSSVSATSVPPVPAANAPSTPR